METLGTLFEYISFLALPVYLIYLSLYRLPAQQRLEQRVLANHARFQTGAYNNRHWRVTLAHILNPACPTTAEFIYALEIRSDRWYWPAWSKVYLEVSDCPTTFLRKARATGPKLSDSLRGTDHFQVEGLSRAIHYGIITITAVMLIDVLIYHHYFVWP